jgi:hypothetical protein
MDEVIRLLASLSCLTGLTSRRYKRPVTKGRYSTLHFLFSDVRAEILRRVLIQTTPEGAANCYGRAIARETGFALRTVQEELGKLQQIGLLTSQRVRSRRIYRANRKSALFESLKSLFAAANCPRHFRSHHQRPNQRWRWSITNPKG